MGMTVIVFRKNFFIFLDIFLFFSGSKLWLTQKLENQSRHNPSSPKKC